MCELFFYWRLLARNVSVWTTESRQKGLRACSRRLDDLHTVLLKKDVLQESIITSLPKKKARSSTAVLELQWFHEQRDLWFTTQWMPPPGHQPSQSQTQLLICHPDWHATPTDVPPRRSAWRWRQRSTLAFGAKSLVLIWLCEQESCQPIWDKRLTRFVFHHQFVTA